MRVYRFLFVAQSMQMLDCLAVLCKLVAFSYIAFTGRNRLDLKDSLNPGIVKLHLRIVSFSFNGVFLTYLASESPSLNRVESGIMHRS